MKNDYNMHMPSPNTGSSLKPLKFSSMNMISFSIEIMIFLCSDLNWE